MIDSILVAFGDRGPCNLLWAHGSLLIFSLLLTQPPLVSAQQWPQILGPGRDGVAQGEKLLDKFPADGPRTIWTHPLGQGYAGPAIIDDQVIVFHRIDDQQLAQSLDANTGKVNWTTSLPATYRSGGIDADTGPKCVPLIHEGRIYLFDAAGILFCLDLDDGSQIWSRNTMQDFRAPAGYFGFGSTPLVIDKKLLVNVGGNNAGVVAFGLDDGKTIWQALDERASYSSPIEMQYNQKSVAVIVTRLKLLGIDPSTGNVLFEFPFGKRGPTVNAAVPVAVGNAIFVTASYGVGSRLVSTDGVKPKVVWESASLASQYSTPVLYDGHLYGYSGREDTGDGSFRCVNAATGKLMWEQTDMPVGHCLLAGDRILMLSCKGNLHIIKPGTGKFESVFRCALFDTNSRAIPAISRGKLYARSNYAAGNAKLICVEIGTR